jgi:CubicO group peptidase (beta-lactamase class C family)
MMVDKIATLDQVTPPGMFWSYCNTGFNIAGRLLEVLSGQSSEKAIQDLVFQPLGMQSSLFYPDDALLLRRFVAGHEKREGKMRVASPWAIGRAGNCVGGAVCSVGDLLSYARFMMDGGVTASGERILSRPTVDRMLSPVTDASYGRRIALAWNLREPGGIAVYGHGGATHGQQAVLHFAPGKDFAVALLTNANAGGIATDGLLAQAMDIWFGARSPSPERQKLPPRLVGECAGLYELPMSSFRIIKRAGGIVIEDIPRGGFPTPSTPAGEADPPVRGVYCGKDRFLLLDEPRKGGVAEFLRDDQGRVAWCRLGGRVHPKIAEGGPRA